MIFPTQGSNSCLLHHLHLNWDLENKTQPAKGSVAWRERSLLNRTNNASKVWGHKEHGNIKRKATLHTGPAGWGTGNTGTGAVLGGRQAGWGGLKECGFKCSGKPLKCFTRRSDMILSELETATCSSESIVFPPWARSQIPFPDFLCNWLWASRATVSCPWKWVVPGTWPGLAQKNLPWGPPPAVPPSDWANTAARIEMAVWTPSDCTPTWLVGQNRPAWLT